MSGRPKSVDSSSKMVSVRFSKDELEILHECRTMEVNGVAVQIPLASLIRQLAIGECIKMKGGD